MFRSTRRALTTLAACGAVSMGVTSSGNAQTVAYVGGTSPPQISVSATPGSTITRVDCTAGRILVAPQASAQHGYINGQYATYRYNLQSRTTGWSGTSGWAGSTLLPYSGYQATVFLHYPTVDLPVANFSAGRGHSWTVRVQYARWTAGGWTYTDWRTPTNGYSHGGTQRWYANCLT